MIIALNAYAQSGKDTVADYLVLEHNFVRLTFADKLREFVWNINPIVGFDNDLGPVRYQDVVRSLGYERAKKDYPEVREMLQRVGTEGGRETLYDNVWVDATIRQISSHRDYVITDCRFPNEYTAVANLIGGFNVHIERPGYGPVNNHISETALEGYKFDYEILNNSSLDDLHAAARDMLYRLRGKLIHS